MCAVISNDIATGEGGGGGCLFRDTAPRAWNSPPTDLKLECSIASFGTHLKPEHRPHRYAKENMVWIRTPDTDYFQNLTGTSLCKDTSAAKFYENPITSLEIWAKLRRNFPSRNVWRVLQNIPGSESVGGWLPNLISSSLSTDTSVVKFSFNSFYIKLLTAKQTDRQTPGIT